MTRISKLSKAFFNKSKQEAQLMLTNARNAFRGQSMSPNIVPFHMLIVIVIVIIKFL